MKRTLAPLLLALLAGCGGPGYRNASGITGGNGYGETSLAPGMYWLEYGWANVTAQDTQELERMSTFWNQRAQELCPDGFIGQGKVASSTEAKVERFFCDRRFCQNDQIIAGKIQCKVKRTA